ncbi:MAG: hypothetical protein EP298_06670 [Gammaproteobacteria bacterium]|nr:MAG: hypothetical protein EP298_06670 [Gammaproteobacteria bacterium]UTW42610.1 hypothetical protein KFE69_00225 [bacterium SCSIO 12844]
MNTSNLINKKIIIYAETSIDKNTITKLLPNAFIDCAIKAGSLISAVSQGYQIAIIIDGYFNFTRAIWHKEILWAIKQGVTVVGCASMGALRASELDSFGMIGCGYIYNAYKNKLTDDDSEVALHYYKTEKQTLATLPLINFRYLFERLKKQKKITPQTAYDCFKQIQAVFYKRRTWQALETLFDPPLFNLIKTNYVDIKYTDAFDCLKNLSALLSRHANKDFYLPHSLFLKRLISDVSQKDEFSQLKESLTNNQAKSDRVEHQDNKRIDELMKLTHLEKPLISLAYHLILDKDLQLTATGFKQSLERFRLINHLQQGEEFKLWCQKKQLDFSVIEQTFKDYFLLKRILS